MSVHAYPRAVAIADFTRAGAGLCLAATPLLLVDTVPVVTALLAVLVAVFAVYALRTAGRQLTRVEIDEEGVRARGPRPHTVSWRSLERVKLAYYSTRRDRTGGWLQLSITGGTGTLKVDSRIAGFDRLAQRAVTAARKKDLKLDPTTLYNFQSLGLLTDDGKEMEQAEERR